MLPFIQKQKKLFGSEGKQNDYEFLKLRLKDLPDNVDILDIGTGKNPFRILTDRFKNLITLDSVAFEGIKVVHDFNKGLPFENQKFDCVILANTLEHSPKPAYLLKEIQRVLKRGGVLIGTVPFLLHIHQEPYDFYRFTRFALENLLREAEFNEIEILELGSPFPIYQNFQSRFFGHLQNTILSKNRLINSLTKLVVKIIWKLQRIILKIMNPIYHKCRVDDLMVQSYGFSAKK